jgi:two-component system, OmpR family, response regulator
MRVLVVEDAVKMGGLLRRGLQEEGHAVDLVRTGTDGVWLGVERDYDVVVLDVMLGDMDGFQVCRQLREEQQWMPVLMLTARDGVEDRVRGLDAGADDYLTKPFAFTELLARVRALARRGRGERPAVLQVGDLSLDPATHEVMRGGRPVSLTAREFGLLECFMRRPGEVLSRTWLLEQVWDFVFDGDPHVVTVYVGYLREKIDIPFGRSTLRTVRGAGYQLRDDRASAAD